MFICHTALGSAVHKTRAIYTARSIGVASSISTCGSIGSCAPCAGGKKGRVNNRSRRGQRPGEGSNTAELDRGN